MTSPREIIEGIQIQGEDERIPYTVDISEWGNTPTDITVVVKDSAGTDVTRDVTALVISTRARSSNVATIVTDSAHGLTTGNLVTIFSCAGTGYNAADVAVTVVNTTTFTYANTGSDEATATETTGRVKTPTSATATSPTTTTIQTPRFLKLTAGSEYRVELKFTVGGAIVEPFFLIRAEV